MAVLQITEVLREKIGLKIEKDLHGRGSGRRRRSGMSAH